jgi:UPF0042 nucleotide-binding protein
VKAHPAKVSPQLVIITGLSGSGKGSVLRTFEDLGYYCVDNMPVTLMPAFSELYREGGGEIERAALLVDVREGDQLTRFPETFKRLRAVHPATLVFIEATTPALVRRFSETRRPHPMGRERTVRDGIRRERQRMAGIRKLADVLIDTTQFNVHELRQVIADRFQSANRAPVLVSLVSFGYRYGIPLDADLVFDVRFLPNPHFVPRLRRLTGKDKAVARFIRSFPVTSGFLKRLDGLLGYLIPRYISEGKSYLTMAFGCTGGRHRSVLLAEEMRKLLARRSYTAKVTHRDVQKGEA